MKILRPRPQPVATPNTRSLGIQNPGEYSPKDQALRLFARQQTDVDAIRASARPGAGVVEMSESLVHLRSLASGVGPQLAPILSNPDVTDVLINSAQVWVDRGAGLERSPIDLGNERDVRSLAIHMAAACGRRLDEASPIVDGTLPSGVRLHAVLEPLSTCGTIISLRTSTSGGLGLDAMEESGSVCPPMARILRALVHERANVLVSGATGSGKTTLLAALLGLVPADERIICIEEITELRPNHPHVVNLCERRPNVQGAGAVTLSDLVRAAMRMRPDRLVLGECRGPEVRDVLTALNTGHDGGWATIHANGVDEVPARLEALGALADMGERAVAAQAVAAFDAVVHMRRRPRSSLGHSETSEGGTGIVESADGGGPGRWVSQIGVLGRQGGELVCSLACSADAEGNVDYGPGWQALAACLALTDDLGH
ncbi:TadA family conjugal transfer-associated ATPase [Schaalia vaccimaxillae]|uniref:TadA family conjugal transfer-associated ATPase n=1 Tax=Schaalia vaccimaxillae TaxID=183916 RepID=UPI0003B3C790|nr:TadA family conjugal transfer-associated ATPase [Schaalia vaccimaxillae]